jgi:hypothetical protein
VYEEMMNAPVGWSARWPSTIGFFFNRMAGTSEATAYIEPIGYPDIPGTTSRSTRRSRRCAAASCRCCRR